MPQYYDNEEYDFEANGNYSDVERPGCYTKPYCPPPCPTQQPTQVAGAQTAPQQQSPLLCVPVGANNLVAGIQSNGGQVAGAQSPYGGGFYPPYPFYPGFGFGYGCTWIWAVVVIVVILLIICGLWWWSGGRWR